MRKLAQDGLVELDARLRVPHGRAGEHAAGPRRSRPTRRSRSRRSRRCSTPGGGDLLLYGVTGSGKTEVYLRAAESALARGRTVLVLVPEIALSPQTARRFAARFGDQVAVLHSGISDGERRAVREAAISGDVRVVVGARSAVFAPLPDVGLIIVDEEHESAYKQGDDPRYDARRVAAKRARLEGAALVLGSATPRPESWARLPRATLPDARRRQPAARRGRRSAPRRAVSALAAAAHRPDRASPTRAGARSCCSTAAARRRRCTAAAAARASAATAATSASRCTPGIACAATTAATRSARRARARTAARSSSPDSARAPSASARPSRSCLPHIPVLRLDADATERRGSLDATLERFASEPAAVLVGTQMVAKGHDFRDLRLAAAIDADQGLAWPDFRSEERTFALLAQLAGRSGRRGDPGSVVFQAWDPDQRVVRLAAEHAVEAFLAGELERRERLGYPPFRHLVRVEIGGPAAGRRDGGARGPARRSRAGAARATRCSGRRRSSGCADASGRSCS